MTDTSNPPNNDFQQIRDELKIPRSFPSSVMAEAELAARRDPFAPELSARRQDLLSVPFVTIDPPGSRDLDQAFFMEQAQNGYVVRYAIADVGFFVKRGGEIEQEAWRRGQTLYSPDLRTPLYPPIISEGGASLLPGVTRPAIVFTFSLDSRAKVGSLDIARALVRSRAQLNYPEVSEHLAKERGKAGSGQLANQEWSAAISLLEEVGRKRQLLEAERGGVSLRIPSQQVQRWTTAVTGYRLAFETASEVEEWNAQISLMTGMGAARTMIHHGIGLLRALSPPRPDRLQALKLTASALGVNWPSTLDYDDFVRSLDPHKPLNAVMLHQAARVTGGARYVTFEGETPQQAFHSAIAAFYAHVTAPLRRLADRYALDLLVALSTGVPPGPELIAAFSELPQVMAAADNVSRRLESAIVDFAEACILENRIGEKFDAMVIALRADGVVVQITDPPIRTLIPAASFALTGQTEPALLSKDGVTLNIGPAQVSLGQPLRMKLEAANPVARSLLFSVALES